MNPELKRYLIQTYQRDILHAPGPVVKPQITDDLYGEVKAELDRIEALRLGANLANRDFVSYQSRRVLVPLETELRGMGAVASREGADHAGFAAVTGVPPRMGTLAATEGSDTAGFAGTKT